MFQAHSTPFLCSCSRSMVLLPQSQSSEVIFYFFLSFTLSSMVSKSCQFTLNPRHCLSSAYNCNSHLPRFPATGYLRCQSSSKSEGNITEFSVDLFLPCVNWPSFIYWDFCLTRLWIYWRQRLCLIHLCVPVFNKVPSMRVVCATWVNVDGAGEQLRAQGLESDRSRLNFCLLCHLLSC